MQKFLLIFLVSVFSFSCKNSDKQDSNIVDTKTEINLQKKFIVNFNFKTSKADIFKITMMNIEVDDLQKKNIEIFEDVIPSTTDDAIVAEFDANNISKNIVINLGNKQVKEVEIISISVSYGDNHFNFNTAKEFHKYFAFNRFVKKDEESKILTTQKVDGRHNPAISMKQNLIKLLNR